MTKKVLFVGHMLRGHMLVFHLPYMRWFREQGYHVDMCARNDTGVPTPEAPDCDRYFDMSFNRSPLNRGNLRVYRQLKELIDKEDYDLIHCNTPVGGMLTRLAARKARKRGTRVIYTAHGFHFFKGAPLKYWLLYYPVERFLSRFTDLLITINREDAKRAKHFHAGETAMVNGVGVDLTRFAGDFDKAAMRASLGLSMADKVVICVGEHIPRKNHEVVLRAVSRVPGAQLLFAGVGAQTEMLKALAEELHMAERTHFLGFRKDIPALLRASDVFMFPSLQEGLPVSLMEAMAAGLACVVSRVRGNADLIVPNEGGTLREPNDWEGFAADIDRLLHSDALRMEMGERNRREMEQYSLSAVKAQMVELYEEQLRKGRG